jgi:diguanylate cyclase (GGDEF)-like protein
LICLDIDNFKKINDSLGHQTGDVLIKKIAKRLQKMAETQATCYRLVRLFSKRLVKTLNAGITCIFKTFAYQYIKN